MLKEYHHVAADKGEAARMALEAGLDVELPFTDCYGDPLREAVQQGKIPESLIDVSVRRVLAQKFALGLFENPYVDADAVVFDTPEQRQLARQIAQKSIVLLKNDGDLLPLSKQIDSIAVIGPNADSVRNLFGDYALPRAHRNPDRSQAAEQHVQPAAAGRICKSAEDFIPAISVLAAIKAQVSAEHADPLCQRLRRAATTRRLALPKRSRRHARRRSRSSSSATKAGWPTTAPAAKRATAPN